MQVVAPGVHTCVWQVFMALQYCPITQSVSATQSTQWPRAVSQTWPIPLHCRPDVHGVGGATHAWARQT